MVRTSTTKVALLLGATAVLSIVSTNVAEATSVALEALESLPSFELPSFDYPSLLRDGGSSPTRVLAALEKDGILALRNIPNYANLRERFLHSAVECAVAAERDDESDNDKSRSGRASRFLSTKFFEDGTKRLTLEAHAGRELATVASSAIAAKCPQYHALHAEFSRTLEHAVTTFGDALDRSDFSVSDGDVAISSHKLISDAVRLDHLHVYEPPVSAAASSKMSTSHSGHPLSLPLHEDHGLFIAMVAPMFFTAAEDGRIASRRLDSVASDASKSGLVIRTADGRYVRPMLKADEVVIMMGSGASRWLQTSHRLPAVMHGMQMPDELVSDRSEGHERTTAKAATGERRLRAWFGKMTLLPHYQRILESRMSFGEFTNRTTRYLLDRSNAGDLKTIGCATGRRLHDSGGSCAFRKCTLKKDPSIVPPTVGCTQACNYGTEFFDAKCEKKCDCEELPRDGVICWMLCTERFPADECPVENQVCDGLRNTCALSTTPAPSPSSPTLEPTMAPTPAPSSAVPTPEPALSSVQPAPTASTPEPVAPAPAPTTTAPTPAPSATSPSSPEPTLPVRGQC